MNDIWKTSMDRSDNGTFNKKFQDEEKKLRSIRLTDTAWNYLQEIATEREISRTDVIEAWARHRDTEQEIVLRAIEEFINQKRSEWGLNNSQKGEFSTSSRTWDVFKQFKKLIEEAPYELLGENND